MANQTQTGIAPKAELTGEQKIQKVRELFADALKHSRQVDLETWKRSRSFWSRLKERWAYFVLVRVDPHVARWQWRSLPD